jgi:hypothetical protein
MFLHTLYQPTIALHKIQFVKIMSYVFRHQSVILGESTKKYTSTH